ncbi:MAG TPA: GNAT family N-acetyltransferase [Candidatus Limnocylindrales bacterium]|nr:GNAT family N-acetyltransferase [Candidatus Limnocylindrales bacterium]
MTSIRAATDAELADWDERTVDAPGGHVYQSRAWAEHRVRAGWAADHLVLDGGFRVLALRRPFPIVGGASAYIPRGPIAAGDPAERVAGRLAAVTDHLAADGVAVVASDAEIPADSGYRDHLAAIGFRPIEEIQPSRHRLTLPLAGRDPDAVFGGIAKSTRQRIRKAEKDGIAVVRHDGRLPSSGVGEGFASPSEPAEVALDRFYDLLLETGERLQFSFGPRERFLAWWRSALRAGHLVQLEARTAEGEPQAGLVLYRHGERLSTVHSGDHAAARRDHPGALHLLRWRAIQLAMTEGRTEMDLGGVDVAGARREPREGEPTWGLYQHKRSFGGEWLELAGAHERVLDPSRYRLGRLAARAARILRRG